MENTTADEFQSFKSKLLSLSETGREKLKNSVENAAEENQEQEYSVDMTPHKTERAFNRVYKSFRTPVLPRTDIYIEQITPYIKALLGQQITKLGRAKYSCLFGWIRICKKSRSFIWIQRS